MRKMFSAMLEHLKVSRWTIITANNLLASSAILMLTITRPACEVHYKTCELWDWAKRPQGLSTSCGGAVQDGGEEFKLTSFTHKERPNHFQNLRISAFPPRSPPLPWKTGLPPQRSCPSTPHRPSTPPNISPSSCGQKGEKKQTEISTLVRYCWRTWLYLIFLEKWPCYYYLGGGGHNISSN